MESQKTSFKTIFICFLLFITQTSCVLSVYDPEPDLHTKAINSNKMEYDWSITCKSNRYYDYDSFIKKYPDSKYTKEAYNKLFYLIMEPYESFILSLCDSSQLLLNNVYEKFINSVDDHDYLNLLKEYVYESERFYWGQNNDLDYLNSLKENNIDKYKKYLERYPDDDRCIKINKILSSLLNPWYASFIQKKSLNKLKDLYDFRNNYYDILSDSLKEHLTIKIYEMEKRRENIRFTIDFKCNLLPEYCVLFENKISGFQTVLNEHFFNFNINVKNILFDISVGNTNNLVLSLLIYYDFNSNGVKNMYSFNSNGDLILWLGYFDMIISEIHNLTRSVVYDNEDLYSEDISYYLMFCKDQNNYLTFFGTPKIFDLYNILCSTEKYRECTISNAYKFNHGFTRGHYCNSPAIVDYFPDTGAYSTTDAFKVPKPYSLDGSLQTSAGIYEYFEIEY